MHKHPGHIIVGPRITEKGAVVAAQNCYVFNVAVDATKKEVTEAVRALYKVGPRKVTLAAVARKKVMTRGTNRVGHTRAGKKAYVYLKQGDTIDIA